MTHPQMLTPMGELKWAHIVKPNFEFDPHGMYSVDIVIDDKSKEWKDFITAAETYAETAFEELTAELSPVKKKSVLLDEFIKVETDKEGEETGRKFIRCKQKAEIETKKGDMMTFNVVLKDASNKTIEDKQLQVWNGSEGRAYVQFGSTYVPSQNKVFVMFRLKAVQITELVSGGDIDPFAAVDGWNVANNVDDVEAEAERVFG